MGNISDLYGGEGVSREEAENHTGGDFTPLPPGWYTVEIEDEDMKETKKGGLGLKLTMSVVSDDYNGRKVFPFINLVNESEKAEQIGKAELGKLIDACDIDVLEDSSQLVGQYVDVRLKIRKGKDGFEDDNQVADYAPAGEKQGEAVTEKKAKPKPKGKARPSAGKAPAKKGGGKRPWEKKKEAE